MANGDDVGGVVVRRYGPPIWSVLGTQDIYRSGRCSRVDGKTAGGGIHHSLLGRFLSRGGGGRAPGQPRLAFTSGDIEHLRLLIAWDKLEGPSPCLTFLEFELDSTRGKIRLPWQKLGDIRSEVHRWLDRKACTKRELESLVGRLSHASRVVKPGKTFMRHLFEALTGTRQAHHHVRLSSSIRSDIRWWFFIRACFEFSLQAVYIEGTDNTLADAVSCNNRLFLDSQVFRSTYQRTPLPEELISPLVVEQADWTSERWTQLFKNCLQPA